MKKERKNIVQILTEFGWAFYQTATVKIKGKKHTAFAIETYPQNFEGIKPAKYEDLSAEIKKNFKHVWEGKTYCEYAPEIRKNWVAAWQQKARPTFRRLIVGGEYDKSIKIQRMKKYVYGVTFRNEKNGHTFLIYRIRTDDNTYYYFGQNLVKFFGRKKDAEKYAQEKCKDDWLVGYESRYQFV